MRGRYLLAGAFAFLATMIVVAAAEARLSADTQQMKQIAATVAHNPCDGQVYVRRIVLPNDEFGRPILGRIISDGNGNPELPCRIRINSRYTFTPAALCTLLIHEYLHLAGWRAPPGQEYRRLVREPDGRMSVERESTHHDDPRKVMYPSMYEYGQAHGGPHDRCRKAFGRAYRWRLTTDAQGGPVRRIGRTPRDGGDFHPYP